MTSFQKTTCVRVAGASLAGLVWLAAAPVTAQQSAEPTLHLRFACVKPSVLDPLPERPSDPRTPAFSLVLENGGAAPMAADVGIVLGNDRFYWIRQLKLRVRRAGEPEQLMTYVPPGAPGGIAGRVDPWIITLPAGASYELPIAPRFIRQPNMDLESFARPADLRLELTTRRPDASQDPPDLQFIHMWAGTLESAWIHFPDACPR